MCPLENIFVCTAGAFYVNDIFRKFIYFMAHKLLDFTKKKKLKNINLSL